MKKSSVAILVAGALVLGLALGGLGIASASNGTAPNAAATLSPAVPAVASSVPTKSGPGVGTQPPATPPAVVNTPAAPRQQSRSGNTVSRNGRCRTYSSAGGYQCGTGSRSGNGSCGW